MYVAVETVVRLLGERQFAVHPTYHHTYFDTGPEHHVHHHHLGSIFTNIAHGCDQFWFGWCYSILVRDVKFGTEPWEFNGASLWCGYVRVFSG